MGSRAPAKKYRGREDRRWKGRACSAHSAIDCGRRCGAVPHDWAAWIKAHGADRTTYTGDVANKIGTYLKALAAKDNNVPFYVALPSSSFDWSMRDGLKEIPIEERSAEEIKHADGWWDGQQVEVRIAPEGSLAANYGFDVTPRHLVTGLITERGVCEANEKSIFSLFPEHGP